MNKEPVYYRKTEIKKFKDFEEGDYVCELCNGWGYFYDCEDNKVSSCHHCQGKGKLDWITNVTGITGQSGTTVDASSSFYGGNSSSGYGKRPINPPPPPSPPTKRIVGKVTVRQSPSIKTVPYKEIKKVSWKEKLMNVVANK